MMNHGYPERYRLDTLRRALNIYDKMVKDDQDGIRPLYRPKEWNVLARKKEKENKKYNWSNRGGDTLPPYLSLPPQTVS
jgi:hypothetical protein